jgi:cell wall-associated NlpC family hydrolase
MDVLLGANSFDQFATTWDVLKDLNASDAEYISQTKRLRAEVASAHRELIAKEAAAARQKAVMADKRKYIEGQLAQRKQKLAGIETEVRQLQAQEEAARVAAASARSRDPGGDNYPTPTIPAHGNVVDYARSRLGLPYVWAASGPNSFDCSGLTMWAYAKVGISLPHFSQAQREVGQRVSRKDLQLGDLVFFGSPIHHVGLYIGGGKMIEAPHSGANVRIASMDRSDYAGASRP